MTAATAQLKQHLPAPGETVDADELLTRFLQSVSDRGLSLYPAQEEAILELFSGRHVILNTPTGSGKSLVAEALHFKALAEGKVSFYTCPIKALVNEKFFALCETFGPENVGMMTGDASVNREAKIICCTAEILSNICLREDAAWVDYVVMDEFHYYADRERGVAWHLPLISLPHTGFLMMSATLGSTAVIEESLQSLTGREVAVVRNVERPVPLDFEYRETPLHETIADLVEKDMAPIYLVNFTQRAAAEQAQALTSVNLCSREEKEQIRQLLFDVKFDSPYGKDVERYLRAGIGLHHAGLLPKYRRATERLAQKGLLKVVSGTDTLGMGINIPIRTVLFTQLCKFDGNKVGILPVRDFHQIAGRAGRKGFDDRGLVVVQAPEHVIENIRLEQKAQGKGKKVQKKQPPQRGYAHWDKSTLERLKTREPEPLTARFDVNHGMLVNLLQSDELWPRGGYGRAMQLIERAHVNDGARPKLRRRAAQRFRELRQAGLVEVVRWKERRGAYVRVREDLQHDFSLNHTLALFLVEAVKTLDPESESYALDVLTLVESILEDPTVILLKQMDKAKEIKVNELKANGVPYEERMVELEKISWPKPNAEEIYGLFAAFAEAHPWVGGEDIRPKSVARDLIERFCLFGDYVKEYGLQRSEGVLLRYLTDAYRTLAQSVPEENRDERLDDVLEQLRALVLSVDSSLLDEWEALRDPSYVPAPKEEVVLRAIPERLRLAKNPRALAARLRNELQALLRHLASKQYEAALGAISPLEGEQEWTAAALEEAMAPYWGEHEIIDLTPKARLPHNTLLREEEPGRWLAIQKVVDPTGEADWMLECIADLNVERPDDAPLISLRRIGT